MYDGEIVFPKILKNPNSIKSVESSTAASSSSLHHPSKFNTNDEDSALPMIPSSPVRNESSSPPPVLQVASVTRDPFRYCVRRV